MLPADYSMESLSVRLQFRTWNQEGLLFSIPLSRDPDTINLLLQLSQARVLLLLSGGPQNSAQVFSGKMCIYDFHAVENMDRIIESSHKIGIYCIILNVMEFDKTWMNKAKAGLVYCSKSKHDID